MDEQICSGPDQLDGPKLAKVGWQNRILVMDIKKIVKATPWQILPFREVITARGIRFLGLPCVAS